MNGKMIIGIRQLNRATDTPSAVWKSQFLPIDTGKEAERKGGHNDEMNGGNLRVGEEAEHHHQGHDGSIDERN